MTRPLFRALMLTSALALLPRPAAANDIEDLKKQIETLTQALEEVQQRLYEVQSQQNAKTQKLSSEVETIKKDMGGLKIKWEPAPSLSSGDGRFEMNLRGRLFLDAGWVSDGDNTLDVKATQVRAARLGLEGKAWNNFKYRVEADFAGEAVALKDAFVTFDGKEVDITVGQHKMPTTLEFPTSSRFLTFMERPAFISAFGLDYMLGASVTTGGQDWTATIGAFRGTAASTKKDEGTVLAARATYGPTMGHRTRLHLGVSAFVRRQGEDQGLLRYRARPVSALTDTRFVDTGTVADKDTFLGVEGALVQGPLSVQAEYGWDFAHLPNVSDRTTFHGGYVQASYFLTGESRTYEADKGSFGRVNVKRPLFQGGTGALEVAYRFERLDLTDSYRLNLGGSNDLEGGEQTSHVVGLNWHFNNYMRVMVNYSHSRIRNALDVSANGPDGANTVSTLGVRTQVDW